MSTYLYGYRTELFDGAFVVDLRLYLTIAEAIRAWYLEAVAERGEADSTAERDRLHEAMEGLTRTAAGFEEERSTGDVRYELDDSETVVIMKYEVQK